MKQKRKTLKLIASLIIITLLLVSCGGGGGGGESPTPSPPPQTGLSKDNAGAVSGAVITSIRLIIEPSYLGAASTAMQQVKNRPLPFLQSLFNIAIEHIKTPLAGKMAQGTIDRTTNCSGGGTRHENSQWTGSDNDPQNYTGIITYANCKEGTETWNGRVQITYQGRSLRPEKVTITLTAMTYTDTLTNTNITLTGVTVVYSDITYDANSLVTSATATISGTIEGTLSGKVINAGYDAFRMSYSYQNNNMNIQISGRINPICLNKFVTTSTPATVTLRIGDRCPLTGEINILDEQGLVKMNFTGQGGMTILFNNEVSHTYTNCSEAEGLCR